MTGKGRKRGERNAPPPIPPAAPAPPWPSVSPLPSYAVARSHSVIRHCAQPSFRDMVRSLWRWLRPTKPSAAERRLEAALIDRLVREDDPTG